jgi:sulfur carrier protein ThiS
MSKKILENTKRVIKSRKDRQTNELVKQEGFPNHTYVITSEDNIYHKNYTTNTVSYHKINGDKLWEFQIFQISSFICNVFVFFEYKMLTIIQPYTAVPL